jgi:uncharacterized surface protein with fasciclin (FAS1) repeats
MTNTFSRFLIPLAATVVLGACATTPAPTTLADTTAANPQLTTLNKLITEAGLADTLRGPGPYTVFAPTDDAFKALPPATLEALGKDKNRLKTVLSYHVVAGTLTSADVKNGPVKTVQGGDVTLYKSGTFLTVEEALVTTADVRATNGVIQVVDKVLIPPAK